MMAFAAMQHMKRPIWNFQSRLAKQVCLYARRCHGSRNCRGGVMRSPRCMAATIIAEEAVPCVVVGAISAGLGMRDQRCPFPHRHCLPHKHWCSAIR